jgi:hypothetical protein
MILKKDILEASIHKKIKALIVRFVKYAVKGRIFISSIKFHTFAK